MAKPSTGGKADDGSFGKAVDAYGNTVMEPSENVKALSEQSNKRQDDLRKANNKLSKSEIRRLDEKLKCMKEMAELRETHAKDMREKEVARLDSIRQVDVTAVRTEADRALAAIQTLAATSATNAENLRNTLNVTATTIAKSTSDTVQQITERISALEKSSYEGVGKQRVADPQMAELMNDLKLMRGTKSEGIDKTWGIIGVVITLIISASVAFVVTTRSLPAVVPPQVIYAPAPAPSPTIPSPNAPPTVNSTAR